MEYQEALDYLYNSLPMFSKQGMAAMKPGLKNTIELCNFLGNPQHKIKTIHVAGTNGKGSVSHMLASIFIKNGYKTGLYTSPHLKDFRERIKVDGAMVPQRFVVDFIDKTRQFSDVHQPSFFELTFGLALDYFAGQEVDIAVIETGLGGRLDSTNVITPELSVITNIGMDHKEILGDTLAKIAAEKGGIIKSGIPVVIGEAVEETRPVFSDFAKENAAPILFAQDRFSVLNSQNKEIFLEVDIFDHASQNKEQYRMDLTGAYQKLNLITVLGALTFLENEFSLTTENVKSALSAVKEISGLQGRWELIRKSPRVILDVAHNAEGMRQLLHQISMENYRQLFIIMGMVRDKDIGEVLMQMPEAAHYYFTNAGIERALPAHDLQEKAKDFLLQGEAYGNVNLALQSALEAALADDLIVICGSVFVIAEVERGDFFTAGEDTRQ